MRMPPQLARSNRKRKRERRPTVELLPHISVNELRRWIPRYHGRSTTLQAGPLCPGAKSIRLTGEQIEIVDHFDRRQCFGIRWIRTGLGRHRALFVCACGRAVVRLFVRYTTYSCQRCHRATYMSQQQNQNGRKYLSTCKARLAIGGEPAITRQLPRRARGKHRRRYDRIRNQVQEIERELSLRRTEPVPTRVFAYFSREGLTIGIRRLTANRQRSRTQRAFTSAARLQTR